MMGVNVPSTSMNLSFVNFILGLGMEWRGVLTGTMGCPLKSGIKPEGGLHDKGLYNFDSRVFLYRA